MNDMLFEPCHIGKLEIKNRIGMAPMGNMGMVAADNCFNSRAGDYFVERAKGGTGLLITGCTEIENLVETTSNGMTQNPNTHPYRFTITASEITERVHAYGTKIFLQLTLGYGRVANMSWVEERPVAPSEIPNYWDPDCLCRSLTTEEVEFLVQRMIDAAKTAKDAGFDGVEIHAAHEGYLLDQFMIEMFNQRTDRYGGSFENRMRLPREIVEGIKEVCGKDYPVTMRFGVKSFIKDWNQGALPEEEFQEMGRDVEEGLEVARQLEAMGYDALNVDCGSYEGWYWAHPPGYMEHGLYLPYARLVKDVVSIPVLVAGRMDDPNQARKALADGDADMILLGRGLLADPDWPKKVLLNQEKMIRPCLGCHDGCMGRVETSRALSCAVNPACGREKELALIPTVQKKNILVVGAGLAGMEAARVAAMRGHTVQIHEKSDRIGGRINEASVPDFKKDERTLLDWYQNSLKELDVPIYFGSEMDRDTLRELNADEVVLATGSVEKKLPLSVTDDMRLLGSTEALLNPELIGDKVCIVGGGLVGCETAVWLRQQGKVVTLVEMLPELMQSIYVFHANEQMLLDLLDFLDVQVHRNTTVIGAQDGRVRLQNIDSKETGEVEVDTIISSIGYASDRELLHELQGSGLSVTCIGDANQVRNIQFAIWEGYEVGSSL